MADRKDPILTEYQDFREKAEQTGLAVAQTIHALRMAQEGIPAEACDDERATYKALQGVLDQLGATYPGGPDALLSKLEEARIVLAALENATLKAAMRHLKGAE